MQVDDEELKNRKMGMVATLNSNKLVLKQQNLSKSIQKTDEIEMCLI